MAQAGEGDERGAGLPKNLVDSLTEVSSHAMEGVSELSRAPLVYMQLSQRFNTAKEASNRGEIQAIQGEIVSYLDEAQAIESSIKMTMTSLDESGTDYLEYDKILKIFKEAVEHLFDLEEEVGTWLKKE